MEEKLLQNTREIWNEIRRNIDSFRENDIQLQYFYDKRDENIDGMQTQSRRKKISR